MPDPNIPQGNPDMTDAIRPLIAGNWKMNGLKSSLAEFEAMLAGASDAAGKADLLVCPPATLIAAFAEKARGSTTLRVGAQDCNPKASGANTGDISAEMLADAGASAIIVGHSERRADHGETDVLVRQKAALPRLSASAKPSTSGTPVRPSTSAADSSTSRCRMARDRTIWWWPMNRSGR
jgi:hypothetical protein